MGITRTDLFSEEVNNLAIAAKAFAHPARIAILNCLLKADVCINTDLVDEIGLAQPTISQHLRELKDIGLIKGTIEGTRMNYCIDTNRWKEIQEIFNNLFDKYSKEKCC